MKIILSLILLVSAKTPRISEIEFDLSKPYLIYMSAGRSSVMDFPCDIQHAVLGLHNDIKLDFAPDSPRTLHLWLSHDFSQPTNLVVRCDKKVFVFDIKPSRSNHQDYVNITDYYAEKPEITKTIRLISSSRTKKHTSHKGMEK